MDKKNSKTFEERLFLDLRDYLLSVHEIDERFPDQYDIEEKWTKIAEAYLPDGIREFPNYPTVSLGWMMYIGMAVAKYWDDAWEIYGNMDDIYTHLRDKGGYDVMDDYIRSSVLCLGMPDYDTTEQLVQECANRTYAFLRREGIQSATKEAFDAYVDCLHQLYIMGSAVQLHRMGYHMERM